MTGVQTYALPICDSGYALPDMAAVRDAFERYNGQQPPDVWLMLGDNAYVSGTDTEYQQAVFNMFPKTLRRTSLWPALGNHDTANNECPGLNHLPFLEVFTLPKNGEAGGAASGSEFYYSFDHGRVHFVCLDSMVSSRSRGQAMLTWLEQDLAETVSRVKQNLLHNFWPV